MSIGEPQKLTAVGVGNGYERFTKRRFVPTASLDVKQKTILADAAGAAVQVDVPVLPDALPRFTVKAVVEVTMKDGSKKEYSKEVEIDVRSAEGIVHPKPEAGPRVWPSKPPKDCPFEPSQQIGGIAFTPRHVQYFVQILSKFLSDDGRTGWMLWCANWYGTNGNKVFKSDPPGSNYGFSLHEFKFVEL